MKLPTWTPSLNVCAQTCHVLAGLFIAAQSQAWGWPLWAPVAITAAWATVKEFGFDLIVEKDSLADSAEDAAFYMAGVATGVLLQWATR